MNDLTFKYFLENDTLLFLVFRYEFIIIHSSDHENSNKIKRSTRELISIVCFLLSHNLSNQLSIFLCECCNKSRSSDLIGNQSYDELITSLRITWPFDMKTYPTSDKIHILADHYGW